MRDHSAREPVIRLVERNVIKVPNSREPPHAPSSPSAVASGRPGRSTCVINPAVWGSADQTICAVRAIANSGESGQCVGFMDDASDDLIILRRLSLDDVDEWLAGEGDEQLRWFEFPRFAIRDTRRGRACHRSLAGFVAQRRRSSSMGRMSSFVRRHRGGVELRLLDTGEVNLSYVVFPTWRRLGIGTRASRLVLAYGSRVLGATTAVIKVLEGNVASLGVARKLGAVEVGSEPSEAGGRFIVHQLVLAA